MRKRRGIVWKSLIAVRFPKNRPGNSTRIFKTEADWEAAFKAVKQEVKALPALEDGFTESAAVLYDRLTKIFAVDRRLSKIYVYASMASDVDTSNLKKLALNSAPRAWPLNTRRLLPSFSRLF